MVLYNPRTSPSGQEAPVALLSLSAPAAFVDGVQLAIPFDRVSFIKGDAGKLLAPPVGGFVFSGGPGLWFMQAMVNLSATVDRVEAILAASTGSSLIQSICQVANTGHLTNFSFGGQFLIPSSDTPLSASIFAAFGLSLQAFGAGGNVEVANTSLAIWPMYGFDT